MMQQTNGFAKENEATGVKQPLTAIIARSKGVGDGRRAALDG